MKYPKGTRFVRPEWNAGKYWEVIDDKIVHHFHDGLYCGSQKHFSDVWLGYIRIDPKENQFDRLYKTLKG